MNTYEAAFNNNINSDAEYQAAAQAIEAALLASGFLEVAPDTGQLNLATMIRPGPNTIGGFRMYRAKDSLAATKPYYLKIEYGRYGIASGFRIMRTVGTGSNGSGTLTGPQTASTGVLQPSVAGSGAATLLGGGGPHSSFFCIIDSSTPSQNCFWSGGRLHDQDDASLPESILWDLLTAASDTTINSYNWTNGAAAWTVGSVSNHAPDLTQAINTGGNINTTQLFQALVYRDGNTMVFPWVTGKQSELPFSNAASSQFALNVWGGSHTFIPIPLPAIGASQRLCVLWE